MSAIKGQRGVFETTETLRKGLELVLENTHPLQSPYREGSGKMRRKKLGRPNDGMDDTWGGGFSVLLIISDKGGRGGPNRPKYG